jgi:flagellar biosynthesis protein FlhF
MPVVAREVRAPLPVRAPRGQDADLLAEGTRTALLANGLPVELVTWAVDTAVNHIRPFAPEEAFTTQTRRVLASRFRTDPGFDGDRRVIALVGSSGSGRSLALCRLAQAYVGAGTFEPVVLDLSSGTRSDRISARLEELGVSWETADSATRAKQARLEQLRHGRVLLVETPPVSQAEPESFARLAGLLEAVKPDEIHAVLPLTLERTAAVSLLEALRNVLPIDRLLFTRLDETSRPAGVLALAIESGLPVSFVSSGQDPTLGLRAADPVQLAGLALP